MKSTALNEFYAQLASAADTELSALLAPDIQREVGHFNIFNVALNTGIVLLILAYALRAGNLRAALIEVP